MAFEGLLNVKQREPAQLRLAQQEVTASDTVTITSGTVHIVEAAAAAALTFGYDRLTPGDSLLIAKMGASYSTVVTLPEGVTWDGTHRVATLADAGDALLVRAVTPTRFLVLLNLGTVALS